MLTAMANLPTTITLAAAAVATWYWAPIGGGAEEGRGALSLAAAPAGGEAIEFGLCGEGWTRDNCVIDGDTFRLHGNKIRIAGVDTPETHPARCAYEEELGMRATYRLRELLNEGAITLTTIDRDRDVYGRLLRNVDGPRGDVGDRLIGEGLARPYGGGRRPWC